MIGAALLALAAAGANAYPLDIENHARWVVLDDMPLPSGKPIQPEVINLRTTDITTQPVFISAVCGTLDFHNTDEGLANFALFYSMDDDGKATMVGRPFLYGRLSARNFDPRHDAAVEFCGPDEGMVTARTGADTRIGADTGTAVAVESGVAAETEAAALAKGD
jgi:hypothetical protein